MYGVLSYQCTWAREKWKSRNKKEGGKERKKEKWGICVKMELKLDMEFPGDIGLIFFSVAFPFYCLFAAQTSCGGPRRQVLAAS